MVEGLVEGLHSLYIYYTFIPFQSIISLLSISHLSNVSHPLPERVSSKDMANAQGRFFSSIAR